MAALFCNPVDILKSRLQVLCCSLTLLERSGGAPIVAMTFITPRLVRQGANSRYTGIANCALTTAKEEGVAALWKVRPHSTASVGQHTASILWRH